MKKTILYCLLLLSIGAASCKKFLDVQPKGKFIPQTVADYEMFMNDVLLADANYIYADQMTDDIFFPDEIVQSNADYRNIRAYLWQKEQFKPSDDDGEWNGAYKNIFNCNLVLQKIGAATGGTPADVNRLQAEAKIHRAYALFHMANLFGRDYDPASAGKDLAVPIQMVPDFEAKTHRATNSEVYTQVLNDLADAIATSDLPDFGRNYVHPGKAAATALLARVYLYMGNYAKALETANAAMAFKNTLLDYNTFSFVNAARPYSGVNGKPLPELNPENLYPRTNGGNGGFSRFMINPDLLGVLGEKDLRYVYTFTRLSRTGTPSTSAYPDYFANNVNYSIGVPEMMLIKAECLARNNDKDGAIALLNTLRSKRFKPADYVLLSAASADEALGLVLTERRRELLYHGLRWFDLKRLNRDNRFKKDLARHHNGNDYTLPANDPRYLLQIAPKIININPSIVQNPR